MRIEWRTGKFVIVADAGTDMRAAWEFLATCEELFGTEVCGNCGATGGLQLRFRSPQGYSYYSVQCSACKWELKYGQAKADGKLFPRGWEAPYQSDGQQNGKKPEPAFVTEETTGWN